MVEGRVTVGLAELELAVEKVLGFVAEVVDIIKLAPVFPCCGGAVDERVLRLVAGVDNGGDPDSVRVLGEVPGCGELVRVDEVGEVVEGSPDIRGATRGGPEVVPNPAIDALCPGLVVIGAKLEHVPRLGLPWESASVSDVPAVLIG